MTAEKQDEVLPLHGVIYTDGGYQRQYDVGGWGIHGYTYVEKESKTGAGMKEGQPTAKGYDLKAKVPLDVTVQDYVDGMGTLSSGATNNVAELTAMVKALDFALDRNLTSLHLQADSQYALNVYQKWAEQWEKQGWVKGDGQPAANKDLVIQLLDRKRKAQERGISVTVVWVKGHNGDPGNERADMLATHGIIAGVNGSPLDRILYRSSKGFWAKKVDRSRFLNLPRLLTPLYPNGLMHDGAPIPPSIYGLTKINSADEFIGKRISDAQFAAVDIREPDPVIQQLWFFHVQMAQRTGDHGPILMNLDVIMRPDIYNIILQNGADFLLFDDKNRSIRAIKSWSDQKKKDEEERKRDEDDEDMESIDTPGGTVTLSRVLTPPRLAFKALENLDKMSRLLDETRLRLSQGITESTESKVKVTDISSLLYGMAENGKAKAQAKLLGTISSLTLSIDVNVAYATEIEEGTTSIKLSLGLDTPDRNTLSALAGVSTKVFVVTWPESKFAIRYATILVADEGGGIWCAPYSNIHFVKKLQP
jgi:ribonuclease HI